MALAAMLNFEKCQYLRIFSSAVTKVSGYRLFVCQLRLKLFLIVNLSLILIKRDMIRIM